MLDSRQPADSSPQARSDSTGEGGKSDESFEEDIPF